MLKLVELRTNAFGSEQKSLRAWRCSRVTGRGRKDDRRIKNRDKMITREQLVDTLAD